MKKNKSIDTISYRDLALARVAIAPQPLHQKFDVKSRVRINTQSDSFENGKLATVLYTYAHAFSGTDYKHYALDVDGMGYRAWYLEEQLTAIN